MVKFNSAGVRQWGTYYGGTSYDTGRFCSTDGSGNVYLVGNTDSNMGTVIATVGSHQNAPGGGGNDAFLVKFNGAGVRQWGTYYGGIGNDIGFTCSTDGSGNVYLAGITSSNTGTVIATPGSHQSAFGGGTDDFLVKFDGTGLRQWGTYYGGTDVETGPSCSTDGSGNVYLAGSTESNTGTVIATAGSHQSLYLGLSDAFLVKFDGAGVRQWGTYYGSTAYEVGFSCSTDGSGNVYLAGRTDSNNGTVIATAGSHQSAFGGGQDAFLVKFDGAGARQWGTYYGGTGSDIGFFCSTDGLGNVYLAGQTTSNSGTIIATVGSHQSLNAGGPDDAFLVKFDGAGVRKWGTYYGGATADHGNSCTIDGSDNVYLVGQTTSNTGTVIATTGSHQSLNGGGPNDAFLVKFSDCVSLSLVAAVNSTVCSESTINFTASITGTATPTFSWSGPNTFTSIIQNPSIAGAGTVNIGIYTLSVNNNDCVETTTTQVNMVNPLPTVSAISSATNNICVGESATLTASGATSFTWNPGGTGVNISVSPTITTTYTVTGQDENGCTNAFSITQSVILCAGINENANVIDEINLYPNPSKGTIFIDLALDASIAVFNQLGQIIIEEKYQKGKSEIDLQKFANGVYYIVISNKESKAYCKVVKQ